MRTLDLGTAIAPRSRNVHQFPELLVIVDADPLVIPLNGDLI